MVGRSSSLPNIFNKPHRQKIFNWVEKVSIKQQFSSNIKNESKDTSFLKSKFLRQSLNPESIKFFKESYPLTRSKVFDNSGKERLIKL